MKIWYIFHVLVFCTKKNLATLVAIHSLDESDHCELTMQRKGLWPIVIAVGREAMVAHLKGYLHGK
jgi:hypothetical protein